VWVADPYPLIFAPPGADAGELVSPALGHSPMFATMVVGAVSAAPAVQEPRHQFVEVEDGQGQSVRFGEWLQRDDGAWAAAILVCWESNVRHRQLKIDKGNFHTLFNNCSRLVLSGLVLCRLMLDIRVPADALQVCRLMLYKVA
jgi:hypothetical protein